MVYGLVAKAIFFPSNLGTVVHDLQLQPVNMGLLKQAFHKQRQPRDVGLMGLPKRVVVQQCQSRDVGLVGLR
jgi:hypothetical protein